MVSTRARLAAAQARQRKLDCLLGRVASLRDVGWSVRAIASHMGLRMTTIEKLLDQRPNEPERHDVHT